MEEPLYGFWKQMQAYCTAPMLQAEQKLYVSLVSQLS